MKNWSLPILSIAFVVISCEQPKPKQVTIETSQTNEKASNPTEDKIILAENKAEVRLKVEGMVCKMGCAKFIEDQVAGLSGIASSEVNFEEGIAEVTFDKTSLSEIEILQFVNEIHDGQYKAVIVDEDTSVDELDEQTGETSEDLSSVRENFNNISLPQLFTFFLKRIS